MVHFAPMVINIGIDPVAVSLGPLDIRWYGIGYAVAIIVGVYFARPFAIKRGISGQDFDFAAVLAALAGFAGGRLYFVVQNDFGGFLREPQRIIQVWHGGMAYFGAIFAALLTLAIISRVKRWPLGAMLDVAALFALIGQPIGRLGNVINGDIVGPPTNLPWGVVYTNPHSFAPSSTIAYHPAAVYEIIANLVLIGLLIPFRHRLRDGWFATAYLAAYSVSQLVVFIWRSEPKLMFGLQQGQLTALAVLAAVAVVSLWRVRGSGHRLAPGLPEERIDGSSSRA